MVRGFCFAIALVAGSSVAWAQSSQPGTHTAAEENACQADAQRFCKDDLADEFRVASCLQEHRDQISPACREVLEGQGQK